MNFINTTTEMNLFAKWTYRSWELGEVVANFVSKSRAGLPDFSCYNIPKGEKYTK
jgi:hypothetical protein